MPATDFNSVPNAFGPLINLAENWDNLVIGDWEDDKYASSLFLDFPMEAFPLFRGSFQQFGIWRQGLSHVMGLADWEDIPVSRAPGTNSNDDPGVNANDEYNPKVLSFGGQEIWKNSIRRILLRSPTIGINDLRTQSEAEFQIGLRVDFFLKQTREYATAYRREQYIQSIMMANHGYLMNDAALNPGLTSTDNHWYYDPHTVDSDGDTFLYYKAGDEVGMLDWQVLINAQRWLSAQCPGAASGNVGGVPVFTVYGDAQDVENSIRQDPGELENYRYAKPMQLLDSFRTYKEHRGIAIAHDLAQMRFDPVGIVDGTSISNGRGGLLGAGNWVKCKRVNPERESDREGLHGFKIVEANPDYFSAPLRLLPFVMRDTLIVQVGSKLENLAGMAFGPQPGYNGEVKFLVYPESERNPFGEKGSFFCRYELGIKPQRYYLDTVGYLYRSTTRTTVKLATTDGEVTAATALAKDVAAADVDVDNMTVVVTLTKALKATAGTQVDVADKDGTADGVDVYVLDATAAPTYVLGFSSMDAFGLSSPDAATFATELTTDATVAVA
jgi:hypothetical protein